MDYHVVACYDIAVPVKSINSGFTGTSFVLQNDPLGLMD